MKLSTSLMTACAALLFAGVGCAPPPFNYVRLARPISLGEETTADIIPGDPNYRAASRKVVVRGEGKLTITLTPVNPQAKEMIDVFAASGGLPVSEGTSPLEVPGITAGTYYAVAVAKNSVATKVAIACAFEPKDPDANAGPTGHEDGATPVDPGSTLRGAVDYSNMVRSHFYALNVQQAGELKVSFKTHDPQRGKVTAAVKAPDGDYAAVPSTGFDLKNAAAGTYYVRVQADPNAKAAYTLETQSIAGDPDRASGDDATQDGANLLTFKPEPGGTNQLAMAKDKVDFDAGNRTNWYMFSAPDKGKCSIVLKPKDRTSRIRAMYVRASGQDDGQLVRSGFTTDCDKNSSWVKVYAPEAADASEYRLEVEYIPSVFIDARVLEYDKRSGCAVLVDKGARDQVRTGAAANLVDGQGQTIASGYVEQAFPKISRVKVTGDSCSFPGVTVQIAGGY